MIIDVCLLTFFLKYLKLKIKINRNIQFSSRSIYCIHYNEFFPFFVHVLCIYMIDHYAANICNLGFFSV